MESTINTQTQPSIPTQALPKGFIAALSIGLVMGLTSGTVFGFGLGVITAPQNRAVVQADANIAATTQDSPQQGEMLPDAEVSMTLQGARDYARIGLADAPVQIVVFEDAQCPVCKMLAEGALQQIIKHYGGTDKVAIHYRHFIIFGEESSRIAQGMECAGKQGQFWKFHDVAYANQFPERSGMATLEKMGDWAKSAGISSLDAFNACLKSDETAKLVEDDSKLAQSLRVLGTPTLFINGKRLVGAVPFEFVQSAIDAQLQLANKGQ